MIEKLNDVEELLENIKESCCSMSEDVILKIKKVLEDVECEKFICISNDEDFRYYMVCYEMNRIVLSEVVIGYNDFDGSYDVDSVYIDDEVDMNDMLLLLLL